MQRPTRVLGTHFSPSTLFVIRSRRQYQHNETPTVVDRCRLSEQPNAPDSRQQPGPPLLGGETVQFVIELFLWVSLQSEIAGSLPLPCVQLHPLHRAMRA